MIHFSEYSSLENTYRQLEINKIIQQGLSGGEWVCQVKVHGSNASFLYDGTELKYGKRGSICDEHFQNIKVAADKYENGVKGIFKRISDITSSIESIQIFGELFGGVYPGLKNEYAKIQGGILYTNDIEFYAFDIKIYEKGMAPYFLSLDVANSLFEEFKFFYAKSIFRGTFDECLKYPNDYKDPISSWLGLPEVNGDNICEGNVIRPVEFKQFSTGGRVILKNKNEKWNETKIVVKKEPIVYSQEVQDMLDGLESYFTDNRLRNVLSKIGKIDEKGFGLLSGALVKDAMSDFLKENITFTEMKKEDQKIITKAAGGFSSSLIRPNFLNIIDGTFS